MRNLLSIAAAMCFVSGLAFAQEGTTTPPAATGAAVEQPKAEQKAQAPTEHKAPAKKKKKKGTEDHK